MGVTRIQQEPFSSSEFFYCDLYLCSNNLSFKLEQVKLDTYYRVEVGNIGWKSKYVFSFVHRILRNVYYVIRLDFPQ